MTEHDPSVWLASIADLFDDLGVEWTLVEARREPVPRDSPVHDGRSIFSTPIRCTCCNGIGSRRCGGGSDLRIAVGQPSVWDRDVIDTGVSSKLAHRRPASSARRMPSMNAGAPSPR